MENITPNTDANDDLPLEVSKNANNYLDSKTKDEELQRGFKKKLFWVGIFFSCLFLSIGICKSWKFVDAQLNLAHSALDIQNRQLAIDAYKLKLVSEKKLKPSEVKELNLIQDKEEKVTNTKLLSTGVILTLITIIFAVALTIMLNLIKHAFKSENDNKQDNSTELATPLGNLILEFIKAVKEKISK